MLRPAAAMRSRKCAPRSPERAAEVFAQQPREAEHRDQRRAQVVRERADRLLELVVVSREAQLVARRSVSSRRKTTAPPSDPSGTRDAARGVGDPARFARRRGGARPGRGVRRPLVAGGLVPSEQRGDVSADPFRGRGCRAASRRPDSRTGRVLGSRSRRPDPAHRRESRRVLRGDAFVRRRGSAPRLGGIARCRRFDRSIPAPELPRGASLARAAGATQRRRKGHASAPSRRAAILSERFFEGQTRVCAPRDGIVTRTPRGRVLRASPRRKCSRCDVWQRLHAGEVADLYYPSATSPFSSGPPLTVRRTRPAGTGIRNRNRTAPTNPERHPPQRVPPPRSAERLREDPRCRDHDARAPLSRLHVACAALVGWVLVSRRLAAAARDDRRRAHHARRLRGPGDDRSRCDLARPLARQRPALRSRAHPHRARRRALQRRSTSWIRSSSRPC